MQNIFHLSSFPLTILFNCSLLVLCSLWIIPSKDIIDYTYILMGISLMSRPSFSIPAPCPHTYICSPPPAPTCHMHLMASIKHTYCIGRPPPYSSMLSLYITGLELYPLHPLPVFHSPPFRKFSCFWILFLSRQTSQDLLQLGFSSPKKLAMAACRQLNRKQ